jgi:hypothetical protein
MTATRTASSGTVTALRVTSVLSVLVIVVQGVTAGEILVRSASAEMLHSLGAYGVHVFGGLAAIAAVLVVRATGARPWPWIVAAVVFVVGFVQAALGSGGVMAVHVPLAMVLLVGAVWVAVWSFSGTRG